MCGELWNYIRYKMGLEIEEAIEMGARNRLHRKRQQVNTCAKCLQPIPFWPKGGAWLENEDGTQEMKVCLKCLDIILNTRGVRVIKDNVNRDM